MVSLYDQIVITIKFEEKSVDGVEDQNHGDQVSPELPMTQEEAMRFQEENLAAAVIIDWWLLKDDFGQGIDDELGDDEKGFESDGDILSSDGDDYDDVLGGDIYIMMQCLSVCL